MALSPLRMGGRISSATGVARGRIGAFAKAEGRLFALVARHVALAEGDGRVFLHDEQIGAAEASVPSSAVVGQRSPIWNAIIAIDITAEPRAIIVEEAGINVTTAYDEPIGSLDRRVRTLADSDNFASGTVVWVGSRVRVRHQDGTEAHYTGAVEVALDDTKEGKLSRGDAGMPIVDEDGKLIGLVISGTHSRCFIAPVGPFLTEHGLTLYRLSETPMVSESHVEQVAAGLRDVSANLTDWMQESRRHATLFRRSADGEAQLVLEGAD